MTGTMKTGGVSSADMAHPGVFNGRRVTEKMAYLVVARVLPMHNRFYNS